MAEGGVEESATDRSSLCDSCLDEDSFEPGVWYCRQCRQRMCETCRKYHMKFSTTKSHILIQADAMTNESSQLYEAEGIPDEYRKPKCRLHGVDLEFYCQEHNAPVCNTCKVMTHRNCQLQDLEHVATDTTDNKTEVLQDMQELEAQIEKIEEAIGSERENLETQQNETIDKIKGEMKKLEALGQKSITRVETIFKDGIERLSKASCTVLQSKVLIQKSIKELEKVKAVGSVLETFVAIIRAEEDVKQFQDIVHDSIDVPHTEICFTINHDIKGMSSIGYVDDRKSFVKRESTESVTGVLKTDHCPIEVELLWFDVLPGEKLILLYYVDDGEDYWGGNLDLYSTDGTLLHRLDTKHSEAKSAVMLNDHQVIMPMLCHTRLQIVDIDGLKKGPVINTDQPCLLILKYGDNSVLVLIDCGNSWKRYFQIVELTGASRYPVLFSADLPDPKAMKMNSDGTVVYIVDYMEGCFGFNLKGNMLFHYTYRHYEHHAGLVVDHLGALYISAGGNTSGYGSFDPTCIIKLSPTGQKLKRINVRQIPEQLVGDRLYLRCLDDTDLWNINYINV